MKVNNINSPSPKKQDVEEIQIPIKMNSVSLYPIKTPDPNIPEEEQTYQLIHIESDSSDDFFDFDMTEDESEKNSGREKTTAFPWHNYSDISSDDLSTSEDEEEDKKKDTEVKEKDKCNTLTVEDVSESSEENEPQNVPSLPDSMFHSYMTNDFLQFFQDPMEVIMENNFGD